jgi:hypothetical protein
LVQQTDDEANPQNYFTQDAKGKDKRLDLNLDYANPEAVENFIRNGLGYSGQVIEQGNGDLTICCPLHDDTNPSLSVSPSKRGCWHCFGGSCQRSGSLFDLVKAFDAARFREPDDKAEAVYDYLDENCKLLYQVLRYRDASGEKLFRQRQPVQGGWIWNVKDVSRIPYNLHRLQFARTVIFCEGEKDADTATGIDMRGCRGGDVVGTTSGGSNSWRPELTRYFKRTETCPDKRVIVMPDADEAGSVWQAAVTTSLMAEGIEYTVVSFADTGCKDLTEFMREHTVEELVRRCGFDWVRMPDGSWLADSPLQLCGESII